MSSLGPEDGEVTEFHREDEKAGTKGRPKHGRAPGLPCSLRKSGNGCWGGPESGEGEAPVTSGDLLAKRTASFARWKGPPPRGGSTARSGEETGTRGGSELRRIEGGSGRGQGRGCARERTRLALPGGERGSRETGESHPEGELRGLPGARDAKGRSGEDLLGDPAGGPPLGGRAERGRGPERRAGAEVHFPGSGTTDRGWRGTGPAGVGWLASSDP